MTWRPAVLVACLTCASCGSQSPTSPTPGSPVPIPPDPSVPPPSVPGSQVFVGAGDIAMCDRNAETTARLLDGIGGTVFTLGDHAYFQGTRQQFMDCYDPTWGRHLDRTRPSPGNHDYEQPGAAPYFEYFGALAAPPLGYYSHELGSWHAIALNSNINVGPGSMQANWLRDDLAASRARCTIAYWHHPLFSSGPSGNNSNMRHFWQLLYDAGAEIVLSAHDHLYERFSRQDPDGRPDDRGIRQFVVGTGGALLYEPGAIKPNSAVRIRAFGVLKLTLESNGYTWEFIGVSGQSDSGTGVCF